MTSPPRSSRKAGKERPREIVAEHHQPVMLEEVMSFLAGGPGLYLDGTAGGGGHAAALLERVSGCRLLAVDRDPAALEAAKRRLSGYRDRVRFAQTSFRRAAADPEVQSRGLAGALLDLGVSSHQLDRDERGFTFRAGTPLDMRMDPGAPTTAASFLASASRPELARVLREGDAPRAAALASRIVRRRTERPLRSSDDLVAVLCGVLGRRARRAEKARLFQALRMHVNGEIAALAEGLPAIRDVLKRGAALVVLSYHSVEDRIVKRAFRSWSQPGGETLRRLPVPSAAEPEAAGSALTRKPVSPGEAERRANPRARSARLRAWRRAA